MVESRGAAKSLSFNSYFPRSTHLYTIWLHMLLCAFANTILLALVAHSSLCTTLKVYIDDKGVHLIQNLSPLLTILLSISTKSGLQLSPTMRGPLIQPKHDEKDEELRMKCVISWSLSRRSILLFRCTAIDVVQRSMTRSKQPSKVSLRSHPRQRWWNLSPTTPRELWHYLLKVRAKGKSHLTKIAKVHEFNSNLL